MYSLSLSPTLSLSLTYIHICTYTYTCIHTCIFIYLYCIHCSLDISWSKTARFRIQHGQVFDPIYFRSHRKTSRMLGVSENCNWKYWFVWIWPYFNLNVQRLVLFNMVVPCGPKQSWYTGGAVYLCIYTYMYGSMDVCVNAVTESDITWQYTNPVQCYCSTQCCTPK